LIETVTERHKDVASIQQQMHQSRSLHRQAITAKRAELLKMQSDLAAVTRAAVVGTTVAGAALVGPGVVGPEVGTEVVGRRDIRADATAIAAMTKRLANVLAVLADLKENGGASETENDMGTDDSPAKKMTASHLR